MGIPGFFGQFISREVRQAIFSGLPPHVASLAFDLNGVFHEARKVVFGEDDKDPRVRQAIANTDPMQLELELHNAIANIILRMIEAVGPQDCLILAVDGVAPGAKMQQQRGRRERAARERLPGDKSFDRNAITPGTDFMIRLDNFMVRFIGNYREHLPPKVIYSSHLVPGEGEHKIMEYYRRGEVSDGAAAQNGAAHVLYGLDADLIMLSLLSPVNNIYLSRETVREVVNIDRIKEYLRERVNRPSAIDDFIVIMFLIGNDFLPHSPALEEMSHSISLLLDIYSEGDYVLTKEDDYGIRSIDWDSFKVFMEHVAVRENELLASLSVRQVKYPSRFLQSALVGGKFYPEAFRSAWYQNALGPKGTVDFTLAITEIINRYQPSEYEYMTIPGAQLSIQTISPVTTERIEKMCVDYMRTMEWTYLYYREGTDSVNHDWAYPYYHTPLLVDLSAVMQTINDTHSITGYAAYEGMVPFTALHQLVAVLPLKSKDLLPRELQPLFSYNSIIRDFFPEDFIVEMDGKHMDHQGVPIVPLVDRRRVIDAVAQIPFTAGRAEIWMPSKDQYFVRTQEESEQLARSRFDQKRHQDFLARQDKSRAGNRRRGSQFVPTRQQTEQRSSGQQYVPTMSANKTFAPRGSRGSRGGRGSRGSRGSREEFRRNTGTNTGPATVPLPSNLLIPTMAQPTTQQNTTPLGPVVRGKGPTLAPVGTTVPAGLQVDKGGLALSSTGPPAAASTGGQKQGQPSPAQWKQMENLM